jgi:uncharacterized protein (TIGR01319 family)
MNPTGPASSTVCLDVGSIWTKGLLVHPDGTVGAFAQHPTTPEDVLAGVEAVTRAVAAVPGEPDPGVLACSSAGGVLRLAVVGVERLASEEAGHRVAQSAGSAVVHVHAGPLTPADVRTVRSCRPGAVLLLGGSAGSEAEVLLHNAGRLARARVRFPIVLAGDGQTRADALAVLRSTGRTVVPCDDALPAVGTIVPEPARAAIAELYTRHVLGGRGVPSGARFRRLVRRITPNVMNEAAHQLSVIGGVDGSVVLVDVGATTTGVYSHAGGVDRWTVEGDLGIRTTARALLVAAQLDRLIDPIEADLLEPTVGRVADDVRYLPHDVGGAAEDRRLGALAAVLALRRHLHAAPQVGAEKGGIGRLVLTGGMFRQSDSDTLGSVPATLLGDPRLADPLATAEIHLDSGFTMPPAGLLASSGHGEAAEALLREQLLGT